MNEELKSSHYFQLFVYHWTAFVTPKKSPIFADWIPPAFWMRRVATFFSDEYNADVVSVEKRTRAPQFDLIDF
jgi:hypothetical protein